jgi:hypothetical protein
VVEDDIEAVVELIRIVGDLELGFGWLTACQER